MAYDYDVTTDLIEVRRVLAHKDVPTGYRDWQDVLDETLATVGAIIEFKAHARLKCFPQCSYCND